jgi:ABC-type Mn2+/Zn2+ transport system ATPase subunit
VALEARNLTVRFGNSTALDAVDLAVPSRSLVAVLGPNGAGKTTLFRAAIGLTRPTAGEIEINGRGVAFVPQRLDIEPSFPVTVLDVVRMGRYGALGWIRRFGDRDHELVESAIEALRIGHLAGRRFGDLSGGERQRALLAQAVAQDAEVLLLDEPFTGLDSPTRSLMLDELARWREEGRTVLVATHDLESARRDFDLVLCLNRRLVAFGPAAEACTEENLARTFEGHVVRVGSLLIDTAHHHEGAS